jgi:hypothetical protein
MTTPEMMRNIIENRGTDNKAVIIDIQDYCRSIMQTTKERIHNKFLSSKSEAKNAVSLDVINNMKSKLRELVKIKCKYETIIDSYKSNELKELDVLRDENKKLRQIVELMMAERKKKLRHSSSSSHRLDDISESESGSESGSETESESESEDIPPENTNPKPDNSAPPELDRAKVRRARTLNVMEEFQNEEDEDFNALI